MTALVEERAARVVKAYRNTSLAERRLGARWYPMALDAARAIDPNEPERAAGVIAALSPRKRWSTNVSAAAVLVGAVDHGTPIPSVHFKHQQAKAEEIARYGDPLNVLSGPKERAFYKAIIGDPDAVTVDTWMQRLVFNQWDPHPTKSNEYAETPGLTPARYREAEQAIRAAAKILHRSPRDVQATTWIHVRGGAS